MVSPHLLEVWNWHQLIQATEELPEQSLQIPVILQPKLNGKNLLRNAKTLSYGTTPNTVNIMPTVLEKYLALQRIKPHAMPPHQEKCLSLFRIFEQSLDQIRKISSLFLLF